MDDLEKYTALLDQEVDVQVDRPLGSTHPGLDFAYEVNYGFVPGTQAGDGHEIDAYILGVDEPLTTFRGVCVAVIVRHDDNEHKLVVANGNIDEAMIKSRTRFVEQHYQTSLIMSQSVIRAGQ